MVSLARRLTLEIAFGLRCPSQTPQRSSPFAANLENHNMNRAPPLMPVQGHYCSWVVRR